MDNSKRESHAQAVIDIVKAVSNMQDVSPETEITTMNIDSITFIKIIVALEDAFEIEFDSRKLKYISFFNVDELIDYTWQLHEGGGEPEWNELQT